jgi:hypothetical protein
MLAASVYRTGRRFDGPNDLTVMYTVYYLSAPVLSGVRLSTISLPRGGGSPVSVTAAGMSE